MFNPFVPFNLPNSPEQYVDMRVHRTRWYTDGDPDFVTSVTPELVTEELTLQHNLPLERQSVGYSDYASLLSSPPCADLGELEKLPVEVLELFLAQVDLWTLLRFRQVNRRALQAVETLRQFRAISEHAYSALHGAVAIRTARHITCQTLYNALCRSTCDACAGTDGGMAAYLSMLTGARACWRCLNEDPRFALVSVADAKQQFRLAAGAGHDDEAAADDAVSRLPQMVPCHGRYTVAGGALKGFPNVMNWGNANESTTRLGAIGNGGASSHYYKMGFGGAHGLTTSAGAGPVGAPGVPFVHGGYSRSNSSGGQSSSSSSSASSGDGASRQKDRRRDMDAYVGAAGLVDAAAATAFALQFLAFTAVVRVPVLDPVAQTVDWGGHCKACEFRRGVPGRHVPVQDGRRKFSRLGFERHVSERGRIVDGRHVSPEEEQEEQEEQEAEGEALHGEGQD